MALHVSYTVGERKGTRIPLDREQLSRGGFPPGTPISIAYDFDNRAIVITPHNQSSHTVPNASHDVIDLQNEVTNRLFPDGTPVVATYQKGLIQVRANNELPEYERADGEKLFTHKQWRQLVNPYT